MADDKREKAKPEKEKQQSNVEAFRPLRTLRSDEEGAK